VFFANILLIKYFGGFGHTRGFAPRRVLRTKVQVHYEAKGGYIWDEGPGHARSAGDFVAKQGPLAKTKTAGICRKAWEVTRFLPNALTKMPDIW
jgi:hypothetical protein